MKSRFLCCTLILLCVTMMSTLASAQGFLPLKGGDICKDGNLGNESFEACRKRTEPGALAQSGGNAARKGLQVVLNLNNGKTKVYKDEAAVLDGALCGYRYVTHLADAGFYVIDQKCETDHTYRLVSVLDGKTKGTGSEYPKTTPDGQKVFMMDTERLGNLKAPLFQVWALKGKGTVAWEAKIELSGFDGIDWPSNITSRQKDENTILIFYGPNDAPEQEAVAVANFNGKKWSVTNNKKVLAKIKAHIKGGGSDDDETEMMFIGRLGQAGTMFGEICYENGKKCLGFERVPPLEDPLYANCSTDWDCSIHAVVDTRTDNIVKVISANALKSGVTPAKSQAAASNDVKIVGKITLSSEANMLFYKITPENSKKDILIGAAYEFEGKVDQCLRNAEEKGGLVEISAKLETVIGQKSIKADSVKCTPK